MPEEEAYHEYPALNVVYSPASIKSKIIFPDNVQAFFKYAEREA